MNAMPESAFATFFDDEVVWQGTRGDTAFAHTLFGCYLDQGIDSTLDQSMVESTFRRINVIFPVGTFEFIGFNPKPGDRLTNAAGDIFRVTNVLQRFGETEVEARS